MDRSASLDIEALKNGGQECVLVYEHRQAIENRLQLGGQHSDPLDQGHVDCEVCAKAQHSFPESQMCWNNHY
ncbi:hypothetical protein E1301_Tti007083 [Triplophysa tibetana]|uniref:Uncharacterized protein n=1 Tax=Triplophysa tibetana TaxID=1572043 RepID=A0A5A9PMU2_9TELE|nr:hypothetical protein E1301_Tti007083 [Triplophysa tibetana]